MLVREQEHHLLVLHAQLVVEDLQVFTERALIVPTTEGDLEHLRTQEENNEVMSKMGKTFMEAGKPVKIIWEAKKKIYMESVCVWGGGGG